MIEIKKFCKKYLPIGLLVLAILIYFVPYYREGLPQTHDSENHVARFAQYGLALRQGQLPPRFAPNLLNGFGYPVFNYNYPLANILSLPTALFKIDYETSFKIICMTFVLVGVLGVYFWSNKLIKKQKWLSFFTAIIFLVNPYLYNAIWWRGNIGEIMAMAILPWLFYFTERYRQNRPKTYWGLTIVLAIFFLSHNITVYFGSVFWLLYTVIRLWPALKEDFLKKIKSYLPLLLSILIAFGLTSWFWVPALAEKDLIILDNASLSKDYYNHFVEIEQLLGISVAQGGFSYQGNVDGLGFGLGLIFWMVMILTFVSLMIKIIRKQFKQDKENWFVLFLFLLTLVTIFLQMWISRNWWEAIPLLNFVQFPWRLGMMSMVFILPLTLFLIKQNKKYLWLIGGAMFLSLIINFYPKVHYYHFDNDYYLSYAQSTSTATENLAKSFNYNYGEGLALREPHIEGEGSSRVQIWTGSKHVYELELASQSVIIEDTMRYAGWETRVNGQLINHQDNDIIGGRIAYTLQAGSYEVVTSFTASTFVRTLSLITTGLAVICLILEMGWQKNDHIKRVLKLRSRVPRAQK